MMRANIYNRLNALESQVTLEPVRLVMADGTVHQIAATKKHWDVLVEWQRMAERSPVPVLNSTGPGRELRLLATAERIEEPSGQLFELLAALLSGPTPYGTINPEPAS